MNTTKLLAIATLSTIVCISSASIAVADQAFKSSKFLEYSAKTQEGYIVSSAMMAGVVATQNLPSQAKCIDAWVDKNGDTGFQPVITAMQKFPDHHPTTVIFAVLQKACGSFKYLK